MKRPTPRPRERLPRQQQIELRRAWRLEWLTLALRTSVIGVLYTVLGSSQALAAIWLKSLWALLPPIAFLVACRVERRAPTPYFPYGFYRAPSIAFLSAALALAGMGLYLLYAGASALAHGNRPSLPTFADTTGLLAWPGWLIVAALLYSIVVPIVAGRSRQSRAVALHDKGLYADATMARASWHASVAAVIGVLGIGFGLWWADSVATAIIGLDILRHGCRHLHTAVCDLIDEVPRRIGTSEIDPLGATIRHHLEGLDWVETARVRLREEGRRLTGIAFVCPRDTHDLVQRFDAARTQIEQLDWRLIDFELVPVDAQRCRHLTRLGRR